MAYTALLFIINDLHKRIPILELKAAIAWQLSMFRELMRARREREALSVAQHYIRLLNTPTAKQDGLEDMSFSSAIEMMNAIMASPNAAPVWKAAAIGELFNHRGPGHEAGCERAESLEAEGIRLFQSEGHTHGAVDMRLRQACYRIAQDFLNLTPALLQEIQGHLQAYEKAIALGHTARPSSSCSTAYPRDKPSTYGFRCWPSPPSSLTSPAQGWSTSSRESDISATGQAILPDHLRSSRTPAALTNSSTRGTADGLKA